MTTDRTSEDSASQGSQRSGCPVTGGHRVPRIDDVVIKRDDPAFLAQAFEIYTRMREQGPLVRARIAENFMSKLRSGTDDAASTSDHLFVAHYDEVVTTLLDPRISSDLRALMSPEQRQLLELLPREIKPMLHNLLFLDPPDHTRLRKLVQPSFSPRAMEALRPRVQRITDALLDRAEHEAAARGEAAGERSGELVAMFAYPMPVAVISDMLGIPEEDRERAHGWAEGLVGADQPQVVADVLAGGKMADFTAYLEDLFERKRREPGDDMISEMLRAQEDGDRLTHVEMLSMVFLLYFAGHLTTVNLIGNAVVALLTHPEQLARLRGDLSLVKNTVEEALRYWAPVEFVSIPRVVTADMELAGTPLARGEKLTIGLSCANHDARHFRDPDAFDIARPDANRHLAFGKGIHMCLGAPLARLEGEVALRALLQRWPRLRLAVPAEDLEFGAAAGLRGFSSIPILF
ncbi:cytochrome P450 family protein [Nannocystis punicea]|uniref:Cytochrome P450 n=1 Tax=Nannocystis punicea TaxID=2995304 RepID=A0ABY7H875_9BACT|nr:cytochrome P450 [Nannocystis poenicansa]WAS95239.1 cytochrome P450 [Nannocystis poenicansa]